MPATVEDGLLRLCIAENSVLPLVGEELCTDHPLLGRRRERNNENWHMQVYPSLQKNRDDPRTPGVGKPPNSPLMLKRSLRNKWKRMVRRQV